MLCKRLTLLTHGHGSSLHGDFKSFTKVDPEAPCVLGRSPSDSRRRCLDELHFDNGPLTDLQPAVLKWSAGWAPGVYQPEQTEVTRWLNGFGLHLLGVFAVPDSEASLRDQCKHSLAADENSLKAKVTQSGRRCREECANCPWELVCADVPTC